MVGEFLSTFLAEHAWWFLILGLALEMGMILHFLPTELVVVFATIQLAHDLPSLTAVIVVATVASTAGAMLPYLLARIGGRPLLLRHGKLLKLTPARLDKFERLFRSSLGEKAVVLMRITPGLRTAPSLPAGLAGMRAGRYAVLTSIGCLVFNAVLAVLAYMYGEAFQAWLVELIDSTRAYFMARIPALVAVVIVLAAGLLVARAYYRRRAKALRAAQPPGAEVPPVPAAQPAALPPATGGPRTPDDKG